jgi:hypothetical protein
MKRVYFLILTAALAGACILVAIGCTCNPVTSETVVPSDQPEDQTVVSSYEYEGDTGGYPATPATTNDKYESEQEAQFISGGP